MKSLKVLVFLSAMLSMHVTADPPIPLDLELGSPFLDNMVLQRQMDVAVWGWAKPGYEISVSFAGQTKTTTANAMGRWTLMLAPLTASAVERDLRVTGAGQAITRKGVLVGEVWFSSGQSNMDWVASKSMVGDLARELSKATTDVPIREFNADIGSAVFPCERVSAKEGWKKAANAGSFSALSLAFAYTLYQELKVPIGILRSTHGATAVETWTPFEGFAEHAKLQDIALKIKQSAPSTPEGKSAFNAYFQELRDWQVVGETRIERMRAVGAMDFMGTWLRQEGTHFRLPGTVLARPPLPGIADDWKGATRMFNFKVAPLVPFAIRGMIWCQGTHNAGDGKIYAAKMEALLNGIRRVWGRPDLPFYFTQQQSYGEPNPDEVGHADLRESQTLFFMNNIDKNIGMVPQYELNSARPTGIHYFNKLDPGKRLARWALAHQYGQDVAYCGPIYKSYAARDNKVHVQFEQRGPGGGLMIASKGMAADYKKKVPAYFEPARATPDAALTHFRLCGQDRKWFPADARIVGAHELVVASKDVPEPVGVQYAYSATPMGANLYNEAGLPALPFAYFAGKQLFKADLPEEIEKANAAEAAKSIEPEPGPYLQVMTPLRHGAVIQRDQAVPIWGFAKADAEVTVRFAGQAQTVRVNEFGQWRLLLTPLPAAAKGRDLSISSSDGPSTTISDVLVGDVWVFTGSMNMSSELAYPSRPTPMPLLREFKIRTNARRFKQPRKRRMEIGGGRYSSSWRPAVFTETERDTSAAAYHFAAQIQEENVPVGILNFGVDNPPLTWVSGAAMQTATGFRKERDDFNLSYPDTDVCKDAVVTYIQTLQGYNREVAAMLNRGQVLPAELALSIPPFPEPYYNQWSNDTETATHTYNFCISPTTPCAVKGVVWIPGEKNIGADATKYAAALELYAKSLAVTYGQDKVRFVYAQPTAKLVAGITEPTLKDAVRIDFDTWPKSLKEVATQLGRAAKE